MTMAGEYYCGIDVGSASTKTVRVGTEARTFFSMEREVLFRV